MLTCVFGGFDKCILYRDIVPPVGGDNDWGLRPVCRVEVDGGFVAVDAQDAIFEGDSGLVSVKTVITEVIDVVFKISIHPVLEGPDLFNAHLINVGVHLIPIT